MTVGDSKLMGRKYPSFRIIFTMEKREEWKKLSIMH
jgi:hypothetical protein